MRLPVEMRRTACGDKPCGCGCGGGPKPSAPIQGPFGQTSYPLSPQKPQSYMSVQALRSMQSRAGELLSLIDGQGDLPDWVEFELARASAMLDSVFDYMEHGHGSVAD